MASPFTTLPTELRLRVLLYALYRTYPDEEFKSALDQPDPKYSIFVQADLNLGQRTLKALELTDRSTYYLATSASEIWLDYLTLELLEELEQIRTRRVALAKTCSSSAEFNGARTNGAREDDHRYLWISQMELSNVCGWKRKLQQAAHKVWASGRATEDGVCEFFELCEQSKEINELAEPDSQSLLARRLVVCFGPADDITVDTLKQGLKAGTKGIYGHSEPEQRIREWKEEKGEGRRKKSLINHGTQRGRWETWGDLPETWWKSTMTSRWRPYPKGRLELEGMTISEK